jgi:hypothetical protein
MNHVGVVASSSSSSASSASVVPSSSAASFASASASALGTYEATMAALSISQQPDPIHWVHNAAFREHKYRLLHHQCGTIGIFTVRLLQAQNLRRSYWSPLALGPVKLFGLSKAHGPVSSFCEFTLDFAQYDDDTSTSTSTSTLSSTSTSIRSNKKNDDDRKPAAQTIKGSSSKSNNNNNSNHSNNNKPIMVSPVIPNNDHPVWDDTCHFEFPLRKGVLPNDGMKILLTITVREDATTVEQILPNISHFTNHQHQHHHKHRLLGIGQLDLTELCLGENIITGQPLPGVRDAWIELTIPRYSDDDDDDEHDIYDPNFDNKNDDDTDDKKKSSSLSYNPETELKKLDPLASQQQQQQQNNNSKNDPSSSSSSYGKVRVLVSYQPIGLEPQPKDIVAFESFARRDIRTSTCRPIIDPLLPFTVIDRRGSYLLVEYMIQHHSMDHPQRRHQHQSYSTTHEKVCARIHRNAVFVIERQNIVDAATNLALLPIDVALSTPIGQATKHALTPIVMATSEVLMPALLSAKLVWMAVRTTGLGITSGLFALTGTLWHEGTTSLTSGAGNNRNNNNHIHSRSNDHRNRHVHDRRINANAKFVQL